jgi:hypothetical protein
MRALDRILARFGVKPVATAGAYDQDGLYTIHDHSFRDSPAFRKAYERGVAAVGRDTYHWDWRVHVGLWAAANAARLPGDVVECGVNYGFLSSAIMQHLDWNRLDKDFYLLDTFQGMDERFLAPEELRSGAREHNAKFLKSRH